MAEKEKIERNAFCVEFQTIEDNIGTGSYLICQEIDKIEKIKDEDSEDALLFTFNNGKQFQEKIRQLQRIEFKRMDIIRKNPKEQD